MKKKQIGKEMPYMSPMVSREDASRKKGFTENFEIKSASRMINNSTGREYSTAQVKIVNYYRFEGMSDPGDSNILYEIETKDGAKGILITPYGNDCPAHIAEFISAITHIEKKHEDVSPKT